MRESVHVNVRLLSFPEQNPEENTPLTGRRLYATAACRYDKEYITCVGNGAHG